MFVLVVRISHPISTVNATHRLSIHLIALCETFGSNSTPFDFDESGIVDFDDSLRFASVFGETAG